MKEIKPFQIFLVLQVYYRHLSIFQVLHPRILLDHLIQPKKIIFLNHNLVLLMRHLYDIYNVHQVGKHYIGEFLGM